MIKEFIPLTNDLLFKEAMAHIDNREALIDFLKCTTDISEEVIRKNLVVKYESVLDKTKIKDKNLRSDVDIRFSNYYINLEGYSNFDNNSLAKSTSYIMRIFSTQLDRGERYDNLDSMIQINIIENDETGLFKDYVNEYYITNSKDIENRILPDKFMIKYYNLDKLKERTYNGLTEELRWIKFIGAKSREERKEIAKGNRLMVKMDNWVEEYINDEKTKKIFGEWGENIAHDKGYRKGKKEVAQKLLKMNMPIQDIINVTNFTEEEIKKLSQE